MKNQPFRLRLFLGTRFQRKSPSTRERTETEVVRQDEEEDDGLAY